MIRSSLVPAPAMDAPIVLPRSKQKEQKQKKKKKKKKKKKSKSKDADADADADVDDDDDEEEEEEEEKLEEVKTNFLRGPTSVLDSLKLCGQSRDLLKAKELHADLARREMLTKDIRISNALVSMYTKCGAVLEAREVFDELPIRNVVTWNTLITGYTHHGLPHKALDCYRHMKSEGFAPDAVTFVCILKACGRMGHLDVGEEIYAEVRRQGILETNVIVGNALIDMYAKCNALGKAQKIFDELPVRDIVTCNTLIAGYTRQGLGYEAMACFKKMQREGISPDTVTFVCILKACGFVGNLQVGEEIYMEVKRHGLLEKNIILGNALMDMYAKCGMLGKARNVFDALPERDVVSWNALMVRYSQCGLGEEALKCFKQMRDEGISPNAITFACILKACGSMGALDIGKEIHAEVSERRLLKNDVVLGTALVDMYAKCAKPEKARDVFNELSARDVALWAALIAGYAQNGFASEALDCYNQMRDEGLVPDSVTFICILKACCSISSLERGEEIHAEVRKRGLLKKNIVLGNALIDMYAKCGAMAKAQDVFDELPEHDVISWNALISGYAEHGSGDEALNCFSKMKNEGLSADAVTFSCILKVCGNVEYLAMGEAIHQEIREQGLVKNNISLGAALVDMYSKCKMLQKAREAFEELSVRNVLLWNTLISGYAQHELGDEALRCYTQMQVEGHVPDVVTFISSLKACCTIGALEMGEEIYAKVNKQGIVHRDVALGTALIDMYSKNGIIRKAREVFDSLSKRNVVTWNALLTGYAQLGRAQTVMLLFNKMLAENIGPDPITFLVLLNACNHGGFVEEGQTVFDAMTRSDKVSASCEHRSCMIDLLAHAGHFEKAMRLIEDVAVCSSRLRLYLALLGACRKCLNVELGTWAFHQSIRIDARCGAAYVCMRNLLAAAGK